MPRDWFHAKRFGHLTLAVLAGLAFFGPTLAALAVSRPAVAIAMKPPHAVMAIHPFRDLSAETCVDSSPAHQGPIEKTGPGVGNAGLAAWMNQAAFGCLRPGTDDHFILTVSLDENEEIRDVATDQPTGSVAASCAMAAVRRPQWWVGRGPVRLSIGYFMGQPRHP